MHEVFKVTQASRRQDRKRMAEDLAEGLLEQIGRRWLAQLRTGGSCVNVGGTSGLWVCSGPLNANQGRALTPHQGGLSYY